jgi:hypothetical protein
MAKVETHEWPVGTAAHTPNWSAAIWASIIAGLVFAALEVVLVWAVQHQSPWVPLHMIGAIGLGSSAMSPPDTFDLKIIGVAVVIHMVLAVIYGIILAFIIMRMGMGAAVLTGAIYGLVLYYINFYGFTKVFPWFADARDGISIFTHIVQSGLMAWIYKLMDRPRPSTS